MPAPVISGIDTTPVCLVGVGKTITMSISGGTPPYTFALESFSDPIPAGFSLSASTGVVSGASSVPISASLSIFATDSLAQRSSTFSFVLIVENIPSTKPGGPNMIGDLLPNYVGQTTDMDLGAAGGTHIQLPPFQFGGNIYVAFTQVATDDRNGPIPQFAQFCAVARSTDNGLTFQTLDFAHSPEANNSAAPYTLLDLANNRVLFMIVDISGARHGSLPSTLSLQSFDLLTGTWASPLATGGPSCTTTFEFNATTTMRFTQLSATQFCVIYHAPASGFSGTSGVVDLKTLILNAGVWGTASTIRVHGGTLSKPNYPILLGTAPPTAAGVTYVCYAFTQSNPSNANSVWINRVNSSGSPLGDVLVSNWFPGSASIPITASRGVYLSAADTVLFPVWVDHTSGWTPNFPPVSVTDEAASLITITPTAAPVVTLEGITDYTDPSLVNDGTGPPYFFTSLDGLTYNAAIQVFAPGGPLGLGIQQIVIFSRPASGGAWTGPTVFYDAGTNPPNGPMYPDRPDSAQPPAENNSLAFAYFANGTLVTTIGMLSNWCGVIYFLSATPTSVLLEFDLKLGIQIKTGTGSFNPPSPPNPPPFCIINPTPTDTATLVLYDEPLEKQGS